MYRDIIFLPVSVRNGAPRVSATHPALENGKFEGAVSEKKSDELQFVASFQARAVDCTRRQPEVRRTFFVASA